MKVIARKTGGSLLLLKDGEDIKDMMAMGFIYRPERAEVWEIPIQSALIRGYWDEVEDDDFELPEGLRVILWGSRSDPEAGP